MDYSFDLNINTMGRRIRTRLYFSSESHLHTILNVLRFTKSDNVRSLLSEEGFAQLNATPELCYLTQFVMRVFEDSRRDMSDPKRFRVEMLFSPGATATPFHMNEMDREADASRFDTAPFVNIGREDLTCKDVEDFFEWAIQEGHSDEQPADASKDVSPNKTKAPASSPVKPSLDPVGESETVDSRKSPAALTPGIPEAVETVFVDHTDTISSTATRIASRQSSPMKPKVPPACKPQRVTSGVDGSRDGSKGRTGDDDANKLASRKFLWSCVAVGCFTLGVACLGTALHLSHGSSGRRRRQWG